MNYYLKKRLAKIKWLLPNALCSLLPMQNEILLESFPDMTDNTYALYKYMIDNGLNEKYKLTWVVDNPNDFKDINKYHVYFLSRSNSTIFQKIKFYIKCNRARIAISCNRPFPQLRASKKQLNIYLDHGSQLKSMKNNGERCTLNCDYYVCQSKYFVKYNIEQYTLNDNQIICTGLPRNDELFENPNNIDKLIPNISTYKKVILWAPTFRHHYSEKRVDCDSLFNGGLPTIESKDEIIKLNNYLSKNNILLLVKPHPAQNLKYIKELALENIKTIYNKDLTKFDIQLNELLAQVDALITDYSSIYYDFLLLNKPIGLTIDDLQKYEDEKGFVFENYFDVIVGEYIKEFSDLINFINNVKNENDTMRHERETVKNKINDYFDGNSSERVCKFIMNKCND